MAAWIPVFRNLFTFFNPVSEIVIIDVGVALIIKFLEILISDGFTHIASSCSMLILRLRQTVTKWILIDMEPCCGESLYVAIESLALNHVLGLVVLFFWKGPITCD